MRRRGDGVQRTRCLPRRLASVAALAVALRLKLGVKPLSERCQNPDVANYGFLVKFAVRKTRAGVEKTRTPRAKLGSLWPIVSYFAPARRPEKRHATPQPPAGA